jgi:carotenoid 1,2-hydratase
MTERGRGALARDADRIAIGPSEVSWDGAALTVRIDELGCPLPRRIRGTVRVYPHAMTGHTAHLDAAGRHRWSPMAPAARVEVALDRPGLRWSGEGYFDSNAGDRPMETDFVGWDWSRTGLRDGAALLYDVRRRDASRRLISLRVGREGAVTAMEPRPIVQLPNTLWGVARQTRADDPTAVWVQRTLVDAPFYARSEVATEIAGETAVAMHESLSLDRFRAPWVQAMLPFRMPRNPWGRS